MRLSSQFCFGPRTWIKPRELLTRNAASPRCCWRPAGPFTDKSMQQSPDISWKCSIRSTLYYSLVRRAAWSCHTTICRFSATISNDEGGRFFRIWRRFLLLLLQNESHPRGQKVRRTTKSPFPVNFPRLITLEIYVRIVSVLNELWSNASSP